MTAQRRLDLVHLLVGDWRVPREGHSTLVHPVPHGATVLRWCIISVNIQCINMHIIHVCILYLYHTRNGNEGDAKWLVVYYLTWNFCLSPEFSTPQNEIDLFNKWDSAYAKGPTYHSEFHSSLGIPPSQASFGKCPPAPSCSSPLHCLSQPQPQGDVYLVRKSSANCLLLD